MWNQSIPWRHPPKLHSLTLRRRSKDTKLGMESGAWRFSLFKSLQNFNIFISDLQCVQNIEFWAVCEAKQVLHGLWNYCHQLLRWLPCLHEAPTPRARTLHSNWWQWPNVPHQKEIQVGLAWSNVRVYSLEEFTEETMSQLVPPVVLKASKKHTGKRLRLWSLDYFSFSATLVFLHGLGDTGFGWAGALNTIRPDFLKVTCSTFRE